MKIVLVHELLTMKGGAERVLRIAADMFPEAPIHTLLYNEQKLGDWFPKDRIQEARYPFPASLLPKNHHLYLPFFPKAIEAWDFSEYDVVLSFSSAFAHGIITNGKPKHICYVHSPARYLWDRTHDVLEQAGKGPLGFAKKKYLEHIFHKLRTWDAEIAPRPDVLLAPSKEVQRRIELYWRRDAQVVYPPINDFWMQNTESENTDSYFLIVSTLATYKRIDLAIEACNKLGLPLKIAGTGHDEARLKKLAGPSIEFLGYKTKEEVKELYTNAKAVLFPGHEDFGLVPVEAMACGTPVIAHRSGGALETVLEGKTGAFFEEPTVDSLLSALEKFDQNLYSKEECQQQANRFGREQFESALRNVL